MTRLGIQEETLQAMLKGGAVREVLVSRHHDKWSLAICLGGAGSRWLPLRSRREALRTWASLTAVGRFAEGMGIKGFWRRDVEFHCGTSQLNVLQGSIFSSCQELGSRQIRPLIFRWRTIFLSFSCSLAFEAMPLLVFSLAMVRLLISLACRSTWYSGSVRSRLPFKAYRASAPRCIAANYQPDTSE